MRLIDADALRENMKFVCMGVMAGTEPYAAPLTEIDNAPTIEERKGKWIRHPEQKNIFGGKTIECSVCGEKYVVQYIEDEKFCRNCGADMRGEEHGQDD